MSISRAQSDTFLTVNGKRYKVMKLLGKGGSSRVYEAFDEQKNMVVAIKRVDLSSADEAQLEGQSCCCFCVCSCCFCRGPWLLWLLQQQQQLGQSISQLYYVFCTLIEFSEELL